MFLHLGSDVSVLQKDIIGIFDFNLINKSRITKEFIEVAASEQLIKKEANTRRSKSIILTTDKIYFSPISTETLQKRVMDNGHLLNE